MVKKAFKTQSVMSSEGYSYISCIQRDLFNIFTYKHTIIHSLTWLKLKVLHQVVTLILQLRSDDLRKK